MNIDEAIKEAGHQISQCIYLKECSPGVYETGLRSVYKRKSEMLCCLIYEIERLQSENSMLKSGNKQIIEDYKICIAERDELKANQPVRCGEVASHSEKEIVSGCITLMERLKNKFGEYLDFVGFEPECEEERFSVGFHYNEIIRTLLLSGTSHSGGASTAKKCRELGFDYSKMVEFEIERRE